MAGTCGLQLFLLCLTPALLPAVKINAKGREVIYLAKGDSVKLGCPYELEPHDQDLDDLDIEWTQMNSDPTNLDNVILSYHGQQVNFPGYHPLVWNRGSAERDQHRVGHPGWPQHVGAGGCCPSLRQRVAFALPDPSRYDASINLQNVELSDTATYECKVKKTTVATRKVTVTVLERPSIPRCSIEGKVAMGRKVTLRCGSQSGTSPLVYKWAKVMERPLGNGLLPPTIKGPEPGDLVIQNLSQNHAGVYQCSVANRVGSAQCVLDLSFPEGSDRASIIVGAVLGSLLLLLLLAGLIAGLVYCCRRKRCTEPSNQIRVDTAPPKARSGSGSGSLRAAVGYSPCRKDESPTERGCAKGLPPALQDAGLSSGTESKGRDGGSPSVGTTEARVHHTPAGPSCAPAQAGPWMNSPAPSPAGSSTAGQEAAPAKGCRPKDYGGVHFKEPTRSREGLVI
ncbi:V-set and immunoglobulin domain-containing protein 8-like [Varanus komodoensis]|uniref:V-set and immunoglobulin domain-containing protein 8-like n=1 Tax=Varanus komodoensis TaxID=61221 RepID=UPI001CF7E31F|nr:V-set and immunoglobulin domain-containing protein 8-like [Varanus komodoensis]